MINLGKLDIAEGGVLDWRLREVTAAIIDLRRALEQHAAEIANLRAQVALAADSIASLDERLSGIPRGAGL